MTETKIETNCDFCGSENKKFIKSEKGFPISKCLDCSLIYVSKLPAIENGKVSGEYYIDDRIEIENLRARYRKVTKYLVEQINELRPQKGKLLDVGCGYGFFLRDAKDDGWQVFGTDLSEVAVEYVRENQEIPDVFCTDLSDEKLTAQKFDVLNLTNVLEHVPSPTEILESCRQILSDDGLLLVRVPNMDFYNLIKGFMPFLKVLRLAKGGESAYLASPPPLHLIGFTSKTLDKYFQKADLKTVEIKPSKLSASKGKFVHKVFETVVAAIYKISFRRINLSPTVLAIARK